MRKTLGTLSIGAILAVLALPVYADIVPLQQPAPAAQGDCTPEKKAAWYKDFIANYKTDYAKAYELAKKFVACPGDSADADDASRAAYLQKFVAAYDKVHSKDPLVAALTKKDYPAAFTAAKAVFAQNPDYLNGYLDLAMGGALSGNPALADDSINYAKKAIELIEAGKVPEGATTFDKDEALGKLNFAIGVLLKGKQRNEEGIPYFITAGNNSKMKTVPETYANLAEAYNLGTYAKQQADYKAKYEGKDETPESKLALENINQIIDREIDAYARAVALAGDKPEKANWMSALTDLYKFRHQSDAGLNQMIAGILSKPLPPVPTPITTLPTPAATPASGTGTSIPAGAQPGSPASSTPPKAGTTPVKPPATTKPAIPGKPKTRKAHAGH